MKLLKETIERVESFSPEELEAFREWFEEFYARRWDEELERDVEAGKLDDLSARALEDFMKGKCRELWGISLPLPFGSVTKDCPVGFGS